MLSIILLLVSAVIIIATTVHSLAKEKPGEFVTNIGALVVFWVVLYWIFPQFTNETLYQKAFLKFFTMVPVTIGVLLGFAGNALKDKERLGLATVYGALAAMLVVTGLYPSWENSRIAKVYAFQPRQAVVEVDPKSVRFTPLQVAHSDIVDSFSDPRFTVEEKHLYPADVNKGFGYIAPITPDGIYQSYVAKNPGFIIWDDSLSGGGQIQRTDQEYAFGEGMMWRDNLKRHLYSKDRWGTVYSEIRYLQLNPDNPKEITAVAPKIGYSYYFPISFIPKWTGVALVHANGKIENLSVEETLADERLKGRYLFPIELDRRIVKSQIYDQGYISGWIKRAGKIDVVELPGRNQMPYYTRGADGNDYLVTATEPAGESYALFRLYFTNAYTGERTVYEYDAQSGLLGPVKAIERVKSALTGYRWVQENGKDQEVGDFRVIESVYITRNEKLYWKSLVSGSEL